MYFDKVKTPEALYEAIQRLKDDPVKAGLIWEHMRGHVQIQPDGYNYFEDAPREGKAWSSVYKEARDCALRLHNSNPTLKELPPYEPDPEIGLQSVQEWCINDQRSDNKEKGEFSHSLTFDELTWTDGDTKIKYEFNKNQAKAIKLLLEAYEDPNKVGVYEKDIAKAIDCYTDNFRLLELFRMRHKGNRQYHSAWRTIIVSLGNHIYKLKMPNS